MSNNVQASPVDDSRLKIAMQVLQWSTIGLLIVAVIMVIGAGVTAWVNHKPEVFLNTVEKIFTALLPLLGTWVGTVLAFYFSKVNYESASDSIRKTYREVQDDKLKTFFVEREMRPYDKIKKVEIDWASPDQGLGINFDQEIACKLSREYSRIPVFTKDRIVKFMIHGSLIYEFYSEIQSDPQAKLSKQNATLKDFIEYKSGKYNKIVSQSLAFVGKTATLALAKAAMLTQEKESGERCQDVFITETGEAGKPVLGWLSDKRIERYTKLQGD